MSKVQSLPGIPTSPKAFAGMLVEHADEINQIACVIDTKMTLGKAVWMDYVFRLTFVAGLESDD